MEIMKEAMARADAEKKVHPTFVNVSMGQAGEEIRGFLSVDGTTIACVTIWGLTPQALKAMNVKMMEHLLQRFPQPLVMVPPPGTRLS